MNRDGKEEIQRKADLMMVKQLEAGGRQPRRRKIGVSTFTIYSWQEKHGAMEPSEAARLHYLEGESRRLKRLPTSAWIGRCLKHF